MSVAHIVEQFPVEHTEQHAQQLAAVFARPCEAGRG
jgi:hypothetical protein